MSRVQRVATVACASSSPDADAPTTSGSSSSSSEAAAVAAPAAAHGASGAFTEEQQRALWDSVTRALLRLGKAGATEAHARSLGELLRAHKLVKVQINGPTDAADRAAADLARGSGGVLLASKGGTLLFAEGGASPEALLLVASEEAGKTAAWREKRSGEREKRQQALAATTAKREANASRSRKKMSGMIRSVSKGGEVTKEALRGEWQQLAAGIAAEEAGEASAPSGPAPKQPWKRQPKEQ